MIKIFEKWWNKDTRYFGIINYRKDWKEVGNEPRTYLHENGGRKRDGDHCFDISLILSYTIFNYTNFDLQGDCHGKKNRKCRRKGRNNP